jgi:hypothetical protein
MLEDWARAAGFAAIAIAVLVGGLIWALDYPKYYAEWTCRPDQPNNATPGWVSCRPSQASELHPEGTGTQQHGQGETTKTTDRLLALFTGLLVAVGAFQAYYLWGTVQATKDAALAAKIAADHIPRVERAYVHGGPGKADIVKSAAVPTILVMITVNNYGKTPAFVNYICWDVHPLGAAPAAPDFTKNRKLVDMFIKSDVIYETSVVLTFTAPSLLYLMIEYEDMFGASHETGLAYRIFPRPQGYNEPVEGVGAYRKWT